jgi:hypothetical protein
MFDSWKTDPAYPTLFPVNRTVMVNIQVVLPGVGRRMDGVPTWCRDAGLGRATMIIRGVITTAGHRSERERGHRCGLALRAHLNARTT